MSLPTLTGLDQLVEEGCAQLHGKRIGLVCHQASVDRDYHHALDILLHHKVNVTTAFGPQHGIWGHTQDNMIEWEGYRDPRTQIPIHSLYGEVREPTDAMLQDIDLLVFDVVDVGCRVYTFIWTLAYCLRAAARNGIPVLVLDRPNPIGNTVEGPGHDPAYSSFVGLFSLPMRHGATIGEIALWLHQNHVPGGQVDVLWTKNHDPRRYHDETGLPWVIPSPNMPTPDTAIVYPGQVLLEGTNLSEGRGTTRPFEMCAPPGSTPGASATPSTNANSPESTSARSPISPPSKNTPEPSAAEPPSTSPTATPIKASSPPSPSSKSPGSSPPVSCDGTTHPTNTKRPNCPLISSQEDQHYATPLNPNGKNLPSKPG